MQELRALLHATQTIFAYHNRTPIFPITEITVTLTPKMPQEFEGYGGIAYAEADCIRLANVLAENTQQRAGYIAHTKIAYRPKDGVDFYDDNQFHRDHPGSTAAKYRR